LTICHLDGSQVEIDRIHLGDLTLRGMIFVKEAKISGLRTQIFKSDCSNPSNNSRILVLDSNGFLHHFIYSDIQTVPILPKSREVLSIEKFLQKRKLLKGKLVPKKRSRGKSQDQKRITTPRNAQRKKRSKSLMRRTLSHTEIKILYYSFSFDCLLVHL